MVDPRSLARHLRHCFEQDALPRTEAGDTKLWFLALEHLIRHGALAAAAHAAPHLVAAFPNSLYIGRLAMLLERMPPAVDDPTFAGFSDDAAQDVQVVRRAGSTTVLLAFCGRHGSLGFPLPIAHRWFGALDVHVVYLRDPEGELYASGLPTLGGDRDATIRALRAVVEDLGATRIACYGNSNGGYAALLYGLEMGAAAVLAVNAITVMSEERIAPYRGTARRRPHLPDLARLYATASPRPRVHLVHGADNAQDAAAASALAGIGGVTIEAVPNVDGHDAHMALIGVGQFGGLLERALMDAVTPSGPARTGEGVEGSENPPELAPPIVDVPQRPAWPGGDLVSTPEAAWKEGVSLRDEGRAAEALDVLARAFTGGDRHLAFLRDYLGLLSGQARYAELLSAIDILRREGIGAAHPLAERHLAMNSGNARLALAHPRDEEIAAAEHRAASMAWLEVPALRGAMIAAIRACRPFAFIRVGDGEARFMIGQGAEGADALNPDERRAMLDAVWDNWFGETPSQEHDEARARLRTVYEDAVRAADVVGACSAERLRRDTAHYGYLAWQERWLRRCLAGRPDIKFTDALVLRALDAETPFLAALLEGQDILGMISPHPGLVHGLARKLGIGRTIEYVVPGEQRLPAAAGGGQARRHHFPTAYERLLDALAVPRPGCVFLVAAGLLGKVYCARIKALGGIALDIGALADAWLGLDTRNGWYAGTPTLDLDAPPPEPEHYVPSTTHGCLSLGKTGSVALTAALRSAGFRDAIHLHFLGPRAMALTGDKPDPMREVASKVARNIEDPGHRFRLVTCVRDPIARILSQAFYTAEGHRAATGADIVRDRDALVSWWDGLKMARLPDLWTAWFDDSFKATFGFDVRDHPFDHARKSLRFASDRLRVLVLRQEDALAAREAELGWLVDRDRVELSSSNTSKSQGYDAIYRPFLASFVAPSHWLDGLYASEVIRHCYTEPERDAFRFRWSGDKRTRRLGAVAAAAKSTDAGPIREPPPLPSTTYGCLSLGKTGSTALAAALRDAGFLEAVHLHFLGPRGLAFKRAHPDPMLAVASDVAGRIADPEHRFRFVTCIRDPIARILSYAFFAAMPNRNAMGEAIVRDRDALVAWWDSQGEARLSDFCTEWFDDTYRATFGFDFRAHAFDHNSKSLRFASERLRVVVLRQEDARATKEAELGWLVDREAMALPEANTSSDQGYEAAYRPFLTSFVAPSHWLDGLYASEAIQHFYTEAERDAFRFRWSGGGRIHRLGPVAAPPVADTDVLARSGPR